MTSRRPVMVLAFVAFAAIVAATAFSGSGSGDREEGSPATGTPTTVSAEARGDLGGNDEVPAILQLSGPAVGGGFIDVASLADRAVMLWFWSPF